MGKTQLALTIAARLSHRYRVSLLPEEEYSALIRLRELKANMKNISIGLSRADIRIVDDLYIYTQDTTRREVENFLSSIAEPSLLVSQIRLRDIPAIRPARLWRYFIDLRLELDGSYAYIRGLRRKIRCFSYSISLEGFSIRELFDECI